MMRSEEEEEYSSDNESVEEIVKAVQGGDYLMRISLRTAARQGK
jgi:hypothetical protein